MKHSQERKEYLRKEKRRRSMMSALKRMSRFNGSVFFMSRVKHTRGALSRRHMGCACTGRSDQGTERNVQGSEEPSVRGWRGRDIERKREARLVVEFMGNG